MNEDEAYRIAHGYGKKDAIPQKCSGINKDGSKCRRRTWGQKCPDHDGVEQLQMNPLFPEKK